MKRSLSILPLAALAALLAGCGADSNTTADQDANFKSGVKPNVTIPPGSNKPPANFKSSLNTPDPHMPAGGAPGPNNGGG